MHYENEWRDKSLQSFKQKLINAGIRERRDVTLTSGMKSNVYFDIKKFYGDPGLRNEMCDVLHHLIPGETTCVAGMGYGGEPLVTGLSALYSLKACYVRKEPRKDALGKQIEGYTPGPADIVTVVDDVFTTGSSLRKIREVLDPLTNIKRYSVIIIRDETINFAQDFPDLRGLFHSSEFEF